MTPFSLQARRIIAAFFFFLFLIVLIVASVYASGYRLGEEFTLQKTGGIHVSVPINDAVVTVDGREAGTSGFLARAFFIDNLASGSHTVSVIVPGYIPWEKTLIVEHSLVTDAGAFMVPETVTLLQVVTTTNTAVSTSTRAVSKAEFLAMQALFEKPDTLVSSATSTPREKPQTEVLVRDGNVFVTWNRELSHAPSAFCLTPGACVVEVSVEYGTETAVYAEFFRDGVLYQTENGAIRFAEVDVKQPQIVLPLYDAPNAEFRIQDGEVFIQEGSKFFVVSGL